MKNRGFAEIVSIVLILVIAIIASAILMHTTSNIAMKAITKNFQTYVFIRNGYVEILNPTRKPINLRNVILKINGKDVKIVDENRNGIWEPNEVCTIRYRLKKFAIIKLYIDGREVYSGVFINASGTKYENSYPKLKIKAQIIGKILKLNIAAFDNLGIAEILVGVSGSNQSKIVNFLKDVNVVNRVSECLHLSVFKILNMALNGSSYLKSYETQISISKIPKVGCIRVLARNLAGKVTSDDLPVSKLRPKIKILKVLAFRNGNKIEIKFSANLRNASWIKIGSRKFNLSSENFSTIISVQNRKSVIVYAGNPTGVAEKRIEIGNIYGPKVKIVEPKNGETLWSSKVLVAVNVKDNVSIKHVYLFVDNKNTKTISKPYETYIKLKPGVHEIKAVAVDEMNFTGYDSVTVNVKRDFPPKIYILSQREVKAHKSASVPVEIKAFDDVKLSRVLLYINGKLSNLWQVSGREFDRKLSVDLRPGRYTVSAVAYDSRGQSSEAKTYVTVSFVNRAPIIRVPRNVTVYLGKTVTFPIYVQDPDGDKVSVKSSIGTIIDGEFNWKPNAPRNYTVKFTASDQFGARSVAYTHIHVINFGVKIVEISVPSVGIVKKVTGKEIKI